MKLTPGDRSLGLVNDTGLHHLAGGRADLRGEDGAIYNLLSANNLSVAALFKHTTFTMPGPRNKLVHGSFMYDVSASPLSPCGGLA
jgi:hypothetical protein